MPVHTKLDQVALPEKGRYVERPLLYAVGASALIALASPLGKLPGYSPITFDRALLFACFQRVRTNQFTKAGSQIKERRDLRLIRLGSSNPLLKILGNIYFDETHVIWLYIFDKLIVRVIGSIRKILEKEDAITIKRIENRLEYKLVVAMHAQAERYNKLHAWICQRCIGKPGAQRCKENSITRRYYCCARLPEEIIRV